MSRFNPICAMQLLYSLSIHWDRAGLLPFHVGNGNLSLFILLNTNIFTV